MTLVLVLGLAMNAIALPVVGRRVWWLYRLITSGQPAPDRVEGVTQRIGAAVKTQIVEVFGQRKLLKWTIPGAAHLFVFWAFLILGSVYVEAYGALFDPEFHIPLVGTWPILGFIQDFIAVLALVGIVTFAVIRLRQSPERLGRRSRFKGSHLGGAWMVLFMIFNVLWSMFLFRGAASNTGHLPYERGAFVSEGVGKLLQPLGEGPNEALEHVGLLLHIGVMLSFLILVVYSKHLHIFVAPLNVLFSRRPVALGAVKPLISDGKALTLDDIDDLDENTKLGVGAVEDLSWKGMLDLATCTECGRCQDQCPAWNTEKPLSPKMLILNLRDHAFAKAPYLLADDAARENLPAEVRAEAARPLIGDESAYGVIDPDVLWSCVTCGACVEQCPVDIEHVDHIVDMRRYQVLVESNFPAELNQLFKGMENKGNPWNMAPTARLDWTKGLDFDVPVVGDSLESLESVDWLFWVGCAGAYEDRAKKTTRAVAELLNIAGVSFGVLGNGETCTGDPARRAGNEFVFQGLAQQNAETLTAAKAKQVVSTCAHCFNTLKNEYSSFGLELEVVHHTQLLNRLVREGRLTPVASGASAAKRSVTYHDPCYLGRHNQVYTPPRELLAVLPGADFVEMERNSERSFCCGAGGARMWMEENIGERINVNRTTEAVGTGADQIAVGCPFCRVMLSDGLTALQANGQARDEVEVLDVAQLLLASVKGESATRTKPVAADALAAAPAAPPAEHDVATKAEPQAGDETQTQDTVTATEDVGPAAKASGGSSLFDVGSDDNAESATTTDAKDEVEPAAGSLFDAGTPAEDPADEAPAEEPPSSGGSLFDIAPPAPQPEPDPEPDPEPEADQAPRSNDQPESAVPSGGSLFDISPPEPQPTTELRAGASPAAKPSATIPASGSLFDIADPTPEPAAQTDPGSADDPPAPGEPRAGEPAVDDEEADPEPAPPGAPGPSHQPKTDVDINQGGSLFDL